VVSGIYFADIVRGDIGGANQIFFIVRDDSSHSDVLFQTSDESWEAYNGYGGHSFYGPTTGFDLTNRGYKVSYKRPFAWIENQTQPFYAEYPMVRWLERNGYNISYFTRRRGLRFICLPQVMRRHGCEMSKPSRRDS